MSGVRNGVQALIKQDENHVLYVHCLACNLNLICVYNVSLNNVTWLEMSWVLCMSCYSLLNFHQNTLLFLTVLEMK